MAVSPLFARLHPPGSGGMTGAAGADGAAGAAGAAGPAGASPLAFHQIGSTINNYYVAGADASSLGVLGTSANLMYAVPQIIGRSGTIDSLKFNINSGAQGTVRIGVYANTGPTSLYPDGLLFDSGSTPTIVANGEHLLAVSPALALVAGNLYWFVFLASAGLSSISALNTQGFSPILGVSGAINGIPQTGWTRAFTYAAFPNPFGAGGAKLSNSIPAIGMRFAS